MNWKLIPDWLDSDTMNLPTLVVCLVLLGLVLSIKWLYSKYPNGLPTYHPCCLIGLHDWNKALLGGVKRCKRCGLSWKEYLEKK